MDDFRDTQKTDNLSKFFDGQNVRVNPFGDNRAADRAYRRSERIAAAMHLLTNHIERSEPLRLEARSEATRLLSLVLRVRDEMRSSQSGDVIAVLASIRKLISLVRLLALSGFASTQNCSAVIEALDELGNFMHVSQRTNFSESVSLTRDEMIEIGTFGHRATVNVKDIKDRAPSANIAMNGGDSMPTVTVSHENGHISSRGLNIIEVLRSGGSMGIKDICSNLPEYSEKMVQRELLSLVAAGKVTKTGLKRWSRYAIAG